MRTAATLVLAAGLLAGCAGVYTKSPASDDATTRCDARLVGFWRADGGDAASPLPGAERTIFVIGRADPKSASLKLRTTTLRADDTIDGTDVLVRATVIHDRDHASVHGPEGNELWTVLRYEVVDADTIRVVAMDESKVAADVKAGDVAGRSDTWTTKDDGKSHLAVTLEGSTDVLRAYVDRRGDDVYAADRPLVLKRVQLR